VDDTTLAKLALRSASPRIGRRAVETRLALDQPAAAAPALPFGKRPAAQSTRSTMRTATLYLSAFLALVTLAAPRASVAAAVAQHDHHQAPAPAADAALRRHATDQPLRENMRGIRSAIEQLEKPGNPASVEQTQRLAGQIEEHVRDIIANCRLPPAADAALHAIIVPLLQQAGKLAAEPQDRTAVGAMRAAIGEYPRHFDDPDWSAARD
jgi:hypothetical protein